MSSPVSLCAVCQEPLVPLLHAHTTPVCHKFSCQWTHRTTPSNQRCRHCGRVLSASELAAGACTDPACRRAVYLRHVQRVEELRKREHEEFVARARLVRNASAAAHGIADAEEYPVIALPRSSRRVTRLPRRRVAAFRDHLAKIVAEAAARPAKEREPEPSASEAPVTAVTESALSRELSTVLQQGCALCRGSCCRSGGTQAYLGAERVQRYMRAHPEETPEQVMTAYLSHIGTRTYDDACVYQGRNGCTLPREMRADICNAFYCDGLTELIRTAPDTGPVRACYASLSDGNEVRAAFVDAREVRVVRRRRVPALDQSVTA